MAFQKILLATDGSEFSAGAVRRAIQIAAECKAKLRVVTMVFTNPEYEAMAPDTVEGADGDARRIVDEVAATAAAQGVDCEAEVRHGEEPAAVIVEEAGAWGADLILMGRRGKRGLARLMVGDATHKVIGQAQCAVMVVPRNG